MAEEMIQGYASLQRRIAAIKGPVLGKDIMSTLGHAAVNEAKNIVPHKTRTLARSIHLGEVTATSPASSHRPTMPHLSSSDRSRISSFRATRRRWLSLRRAL